MIESWIFHGSNVIRPLMCHGLHMPLTSSAWSVIYALDDVQIRSMGGHSLRVGSLAWNGQTLSSGGRDSKIINHDGAYLYCLQSP